MQYKGIKFEAIAVSPAANVTPLQVVCFFDHTKNQTMDGGTADLDAHFKGAIREIRLKDEFRGNLFETLLLTPREGEILAKKLLLIGLGDPANFGFEQIKAVARIAVLEAVKLNVPSFAFAPDIKDAGISTLPASEVSEALGMGMKKAIDDSLSLASKKLIPDINLEEIIFLAGEKHLLDAQKGLMKILS